MRSKLFLYSIATVAILASCGPKARLGKTRVADEPADGGNFTEKTFPR